LQQAQRIAAEAEKKKSQKRRRKYDGKSEKTQKRHKKCREVLAKQGYLSVFEFIAHMKELAKKKEDLEQLTAATLEDAEESEESEPEELDTKESDTDTLVSKHVSQVRRRDLLMH
jgi:hypothetical protein